MSAHSASHRGGWLSALVAQVSDWVFEEVEEKIEAPPAELKPQPVVAVVAAAPRARASTVARLLAAELGARRDGAAVVVTPTCARRTAPPSRAAIRVATALTGVGAAHPVGRLCLLTRVAEAAGGAADAGHAAADAGHAAADAGHGAADAGHGAADAAYGADAAHHADAAYAADAAHHADAAGARIVALERIAAAARYLAPVVLDVPADGSAAGIARVADRVVVVGGAAAEPALLDAVASVIGGRPLRVANRIAEAGEWADRADLVLPESRLAVRAAALGTRAVGSLGAGIGALADALEVP